MLKFFPYQVKQLKQWLIFFKNQVKLLKWQWRGEISKIEENDVTNNVIGQKRDMASKRIVTKMLPWSS